MKGQKGITLIALIITIIVMLILVAVAVSAAVQSNLFGHAGNAATEYKTQQEREQNLDSEIKDDKSGATGINGIVTQYTTPVDPTPDE